MMLFFNLLSLFEYIGNLTGYFWKGEQGKSLKWKGIASSSLDNTNDFSKLEIAKVVSESHRKLVTKLEDYRANIFHYQLHMGAVGTRLEFPTTGNPIKIGIAASDKFKKIFKDYSVDSKENELTAYSRLAILESYKRIIDILNCLLEWPVEPLPRKI